MFVLFSLVVQSGHLSSSIIYFCSAGAQAEESVWWRQLPSKLIMGGHISVHVKVLSTWHGSFTSYTAIIILAKVMQYSNNGLVGLSIPE